MQIHVARNSAQLGVFSSEEIIAGLQAGRFLASDLGWRDGMTVWTPLGDWSEFSGAGVPPPSPGVSAAAAPVASQIPWEQGKSLGSFFATLRLAVTNPSALATGRFAFGDWLVFCYLAVLFDLPFQFAQLFAYGEKNVQAAELLRWFKIPGLDKAAEQLANAPQTPVWVSAIGVVTGLAFAPLLYAFFALAHWVGQRVFRYQVSVERTVSATLLATAAIVVFVAPLHLLGFSIILQMILTGLIMIPLCVVYYRALGAATGISPWAQFGISCFVWLILLCCCCVVPIMVISGAAATTLGR